MASFTRRDSEFADIVDDASHVILECEGLLRALPRPGEPPLIGRLRAELGVSDDFRVHPAGPGESSPWLVYFRTLVDPNRFWQEIEQPVAEALRRGDGRLEDLWPTALHAGTVAEAAEGILRGSVAVVLGPGPRGCLLHNAALQVARAIEPPKTEQVIVGPKEAFVEDVDTNIALLRGWFPDTSFRVEVVRVGRRSKSRIAVAYLEDVVRPGLVPLIMESLRRIRTDSIRADWDIAEYLTAGSLTPFPLAESTERPDKVAQAIADGRVAVFVQHSPFPFLLPTTVFEFQKDSEAALPGPVVTLYIRALRHIGTFLAVVSPGLIVALLSANPGPLRPELAQTVALTRIGLPYPVFPEMLAMMLVIDIFNEATAQAPGGIGNALSIVGTLIIGQISVSARLVSELVMIIAAATSLGTFLTLRYQFSYAIRIWKYPILILSGVVGLFGWLAGILFLVVHLASLKSAGVPYLAPLAPLHPRSLVYNVVTRRLRPQTVRRPPAWQPADATSGDPHGSGEQQSGDAPS